MKTVLFVLVLSLLSSAAHAQSCRQNAVDAASALYKINNPAAKITKASAKLALKPELSESGTIYTWDVVLRDRGVSSTTYRMTVLDDTACTVFGFTMPFAG